MQTQKNRGGTDYSVSPLSRSPKNLALNPILSFHHEVRRSKPDALEQKVEVNPFEHELCHMVHLGIFEQAHRSHSGERIFTDQRFLIVVKIDDVGFPEA